LTDIAIQDLYPDSLSHCYGCGRLNEQGLHLKSYADGDEIVCTLQPEPYHLAVPGFVYGGLIASIIDCHSIGTAVAAVIGPEGQSMAAKIAPRYVTKSLQVDFLKPTPIQSLITVRAKVVESGRRHQVIHSELYAEDVLRARGVVVALPIPDQMLTAI
jgi:acyl-coenzyme A thioesterase PaaI-like protein